MLASVERRERDRAVHDIRRVTDARPGPQIRPRSISTAPVGCAGQRRSCVLARDRRTGIDRVHNVIWVNRAAARPAAE